MSKFNIFDYEDSVFPVLGLGFGAEKEDPAQDPVFEAAGKSDPISALADAQLAAMAMGAVLTWLDEDDYGYEALYDLVAGVSDLDGDEEWTKEETAVWDALWPQVADAMLSLGAEEDTVKDFLDKEDDDAGERLGGFLSGILDEESASDDEIVSAFAAGDSAIFESAGQEDSVFEAAFKKVKVVRGGKVVIKKKRISGRAKLSAKQKAGLKKARRRSHSAAARLSRKKSARARKQRGL
jgi:hypothetical protein